MTKVIKISRTGRKGRGINLFEKIYRLEKITNNKKKSQGLYVNTEYCSINKFSVNILKQKSNETEAIKISRNRRRNKRLV